MKVKVLSALCLAFLLLSACSGKGGKPAGDSLSDTGMHDITRPVGENYIEDLLKLKDEKELKAEFGADRVMYDTIWGPEGMYTMGTYLDKGTADEVQIYWEDSLHRSGVDAVMISALYMNDGKYNFSGRWSSRTGVKLGMTSGELEKLNRKAFNFSGFGWDYAGGVMTWNYGRLKDGEVAVTLTEGDGKVTEEEMLQVLGDQDIRSDDPVVQKMQPRVVRISVHND